MQPKEKGEISEAIILAELVKNNFTLLIPFGDNQRYDYVIALGARFIRIQCKTGRLRNGVIRFNTCSTHCRTGERKDYIGEIDYFLVYCPETSAVYCVPVVECGKADASLRIDENVKKPSKRIKLAKNYILLPTSFKT